MMFPLLIILANLCVLLASEVEEITCPDGSSCPIGQTCQPTATTGMFHCVGLPPETHQTGRKLVPALAFTSAARASRPAFGGNASSAGVIRASPSFQKSYECPDGTLCHGIYCCPAQRAVCCDDDTCCREGTSCCRDSCCLPGNRCCGYACCEHGLSCCGGGCCESGSSCCGTHCCFSGSSCCGDDSCCPLGSRCCTDSDDSGWCCEGGQKCYSQYGYCWDAGAARLPSASLLLAMLLMSAASSKYYFAGVQA